MEHTKGMSQPAKEAYWQKKMEEWKRSGLSITTYCESYQISRRSFYRRRWELQRRECKQACEQIKEEDPKSVYPFAEVEVIERESYFLEEFEGSRSDTGIEIVLAGHRRVRIFKGFDVDVLTRVIVLLEGLPC